MTIDCTDLQAHLKDRWAINDDVAHLREDVCQYIRMVDAKEGLNTTYVLPLPLGTFNLPCVLQPTNLVLKLSPWGSEHEGDFLQWAGELGVKVPAFHTYNTTPTDRLPHASYTLMEYIPNGDNPGQLLEAGNLSEQNLLAIATEMGQALAKLHSKKFDYLHSFGETKANWGDCLSLWELETNDLFDETRLSLFEQALAKSGYRDINAGTLIHSDASLHNILVDQNTHQFKALFDPGPTIIGNPMFDLAYAAQPWKQGTNYMNTLVESYQQANGDFNETQFNLSLLCVAYQHVPYGIINTQAQTYIKENIFPRITNPSKQP